MAGAEADLAAVEAVADLAGLVEALPAEAGRGEVGDKDFSPLRRRGAEKNEKDYSDFR